VTRKPRVLFVGRTRYRLPLAGPLARKWDALAEVFDLRVLASGTGSDPRFRLVRPRLLDGPRFYLALPFRVARELREFVADAVVAESAYEAVAVELARVLTRSRAKLVVEVHGDWRTSTRLYGARGRALLAPLGDRLARWVLRRADAVRAVSQFTASLVRAAGREPAAVFTAYTDLSAFSGPVVPVPEEPRAVFVGVLERYKNVEGLAAAWRRVAGRVGGAHLRVIGDGTQADVVARLGVEWQRRVEQAEVARALDEARVLVLPSESEGLPRVVVEAALRGRPTVATRAGGTPEIVEDEVTGLLVDRGEMDALAHALERVLRTVSSRSGSATRPTPRPSGS
jgi:glycosyltransferase involved in cell wall biosynthesis